MIKNECICAHSPATVVAAGDKAVRGTRKGDLAEGRRRGFGDGHAEGL